jgi:hypothetical protein
MGAADLVRESWDSSISASSIFSRVSVVNLSTSAAVRPFVEIGGSTEQFRSTYAQHFNYMCESIFVDRSLPLILTVPGLNLFALTFNTIE